MFIVIKSLDFLGYPEYSISNFGIVYSHIKIAYDHDNKIISGKILDKTQSKIITPVVANSNQRATVRLSGKGLERKSFHVAQLVALAFIDNPNNLNEINYLDGNISNFTASNLEWVKVHPLQKCKTMKKTIRRRGANSFLTPGYKFITKQGSSCEVICRVDNTYADILIMSDKVVGDAPNKIIMPVTIASIKTNSVFHPYYPSIGNVGCIGLGKHQASYYFDGVEIRNTVYSRWHSMIKRCYVKGISDLYYGTEVSEEFKNFQHYTNFINDEMKRCRISSLNFFEIDKDFKAHAGKGYCRETITIIPEYLNRFLSNGSSGTGILPPGVGYTPARDEIRSTLVDNSGVTLKWFRASFDDDKNNLNSVNFIINLYINEKIKLAKDILKRCQVEYPDLILDKTVIDILTNFDKYLIKKVYPSFGWEIEIKNNKFQLNKKTSLLVKERLDSSGGICGFRRIKGTFMDIY